MQGSICRDLVHPHGDESGLMDGCGRRSKGETETDAFYFILFKAMANWWNRSFSDQQLTGPSPVKIVPSQIEPDRSR